MTRLGIRLEVIGQLGLIIFATVPANAQIVPDGTLPINSLVAPNCVTCTIEGGTLRGENLFHSFQEFSIPTGGTGFFNNSLATQNILVRVTGQHFSNIDGLLKANGTANLFLLNPNGIVLGANTRLQLGGSFFATTANSFQFSDGNEFSAVNPQAPPLLTVNVPSGLQYGKPVGNLTQTGRLEVLPGQTISLHGSTVTSTGIFKASGGEVRVLGDRISLLAPTAIDVSGAPNGGTILIGGDFQGKGDIPTAQQTNIESGVILNADALSADPSSPLSASGGKVIVWADDKTQFAGSISSQTTVKDGYGGFVEVSGKNDLIVQGSVNVSAPNGTHGSVLLDPKNIIIRAGGANPFAPNDAFAEKASETVTFSAAQINSFIGNLTLQASNDIIVDEAINANSPSLNLTLQAGRSILINQPITFTSPFGTLSLIANSTLSDGVVNAFREPGIAAITMASGSSLNLSSTLNVQMKTGEGLTNQTSGNITLRNVNALAPSASISVVNQAANGNITASQLNAGSSITLNTTGNLSINNSSSTFGGTSLQAGGNIDATNILTARQDINLTAGGRVQAKNIILAPSLGSAFAGSQVNIQAGDDLVAENISSSNPIGNTGDVLLTSTRGNINATNIRTSAGSRTGDITLTANAGSITANRLVSNGGADTGNVSLIAAGNITSGDINTASVSDKSGDIRLTSRTGSIDTTAGNLISLTFGDQSGDITLSAAQAIYSGPLIASSTSGSGAIAITAGKEFSVSNSLISTDATKSGRSGDVTISAQSVSLMDGAQISTSGSGTAQSGNVFIQSANSLIIQGTSPDDLPPRGVYASAGNTINVPEGRQLGGFIPNTILSQQLGNAPSGIFTATKGSGNAGQVSIAADQVVVQRRGAIAATTFAAGSAGAIAITSNTFTAESGGQLLTTTSGSGQAGDVILNVRDRVHLSGNNTGLFANTTNGPGGAITVTTNRFSIANNAVLNASTTAANAGGNITVIANTFDASNGGRLLTNTSGAGSAGNITAIASEQFTLNGPNTGLIASTTPGSTGNGGSVTVQSAKAVQIQNGAGIAVGSQGTGQGGNLALQGQQVTLSDRAFLTAETATAQGGNITIDSQDFLFLRRNSLISASAGTAQAGGDGGNVIINVPNSFVIGVLGENSDIRANAFTGNGGKVTITTLGIYGLEFQSQDTPFSDITASSRFGISGTVTLNTLNVDPNRGLVTLPSSLIDSTNQISAGCSPGGKLNKRENKFVVKGQGRLPESPEDSLSGDRTLINLTELVQTQSAHSDTEAIFGNETTKIIVEAQGWKTDAKGFLYLVADASESTSHPNWKSFPRCLED